MKNCNTCTLSTPDVIFDSKVRIFCKYQFPFKKIYDYDLLEEKECEGYKKSYITTVDKLKDIICTNSNEINALSFINDKIRKYLK